ncbi:MAG: hypothetical protein M1822_004671 [Bathelium mastoideum]|nr:MAG: hypothetical protein M1822_004671 [Bathelium mastoideum]
MTIPIAKILEQRSHLVPGKLRITEHFFEVPRDYSNPSSGTLRLFARSARKAEKSADPEEDDPKKKQLPWMVYLEGGPGFECRAPQNYSWINHVLDKGWQLLFLDQRGTGLSTPISASSLGLRGDDPVQAKYLKSFRADNISFGGFCAATYLSFFHEGLREVFLFGGLPPIGLDPDHIYKQLYTRVKTRNEAYYKKYPEDIDRVKKILRLLQRFGPSTVRTTGEGSLSARRFQQLGIHFGFHSGLDMVHDIVLRASNDLDVFGHLTRPSLSQIEKASSFDDNVIYAILHEPIYCEGRAAKWSAHRVREQFPEFDADNLDREGPIYFTGEMVYPWMLKNYSELRKIAGPAEIIAQDPDWPALYDEEQLAKNEVPVYAAVYLDDMYVDWGFSMETACKIRGCKTFRTNMAYHDGVRTKTNEVLKYVFNLRDDTID